MSKSSEIVKRLVTSIIEAYVIKEMVEEFINKYKKFQFYAIAVDLNYLTIAKKLLEGTEILLATVASYPLGGQTTAKKIKEVEYAIKAGANEIEISMNYGAIKSRDFSRVAKEIREIIAVADNQIEIIMIPQTSILTNDEKLKIFNVLLENDIRKIKLNSGFGWNTMPEDLILIKRKFPNQFKRVDASGGVRDIFQVKEYLKLGASYIHTSTPEKILLECYKD